MNFFLLPALFVGAFWIVLGYIHYYSGNYTARESLDAQQLLEQSQNTLAGQITEQETQNQIARNATGRTQSFGTVASDSEGGKYGSIATYDAAGNVSGYVPGNYAATPSGAEAISPYSPGGSLITQQEYQNIQSDVPGITMPSAILTDYSSYIQNEVNIGKNPTATQMNPGQANLGIVPIPTITPISDKYESIATFNPSTSMLTYTPTNIATQKTRDEIAQNPSIMITPSESTPMGLAITGATRNQNADTDFSSLYLNRPGLTKESDLGDIYTQQLKAQNPNLTMSQVLAMQVSGAKATPGLTDDRFYQNELQKSLENNIEMASAYHAWSMDTGLPQKANPYEYSADLSLYALKGVDATKGFSPVSADALKLPSGQGIQDEAWLMAKGQSFDFGQYTPAINAIAQAQRSGEMGVYGTLGSYSSALGYLDIGQQQAIGIQAAKSRGESYNAGAWDFLGAGKFSEGKGTYSPISGFPTTKGSTGNVPLGDTGLFIGGMPNGASVMRVSPPQSTLQPDIIGMPKPFTSSTDIQRVQEQNWMQYIPVVGMFTGIPLPGTLGLNIGEIVTTKSTKGTLIEGMANFFAPETPIGSSVVGYKEFTLPSPYVSNAPKTYTAEPLVFKQSLIKTQIGETTSPYETWQSGVATQTTEKYLPGGIPKSYNEWAQRESGTLGLKYTNVLSNAGFSNSAPEFAFGFFAGEYTGIREKPVTAVANFGVGIAMGGLFRGAGAVGETLALGFPRASPYIGAVTRAAPYVLGGLYAADFAASTTKFGTDLNPEAMGRRSGERFVTEAAPFFGGGAIGYYSPEIAGASYRGIRTGITEAGNLYRAGYGEPGGMGIGEAISQHYIGQQQAGGALITQEEGLQRLGLKIPENGLPENTGQIKAGSIEEASARGASGNTLVTISSGEKPPIGEFNFEGTKPGEARSKVMDILTQGRSIEIQRELSGGEGTIRIFDYDAGRVKSYPKGTEFEIQQRTKVFELPDGRTETKVFDIKVAVSEGKYARTLGKVTSGELPIEEFINTPEGLQFIENRIATTRSNRLNSRVSQAVSADIMPYDMYYASEGLRLFESPGSISTTVQRSSGKVVMDFNKPGSWKQSITSMLDENNLLRAGTFVEQIPGRELGLSTPERRMVSAKMQGYNLQSAFGNVGGDFLSQIPGRQYTIKSTFEQRYPWVAQRLKSESQRRADKLGLTGYLDQFGRTRYAPKEALASPMMYPEYSLSQSMEKSTSLSTERTSEQTKQKEVFAVPEILRTRSPTISKEIETYFTPYLKQRQITKEPQITEEIEIYSTPRLPRTPTDIWNEPITRQPPIKPQPPKPITPGLPGWDFSGGQAQSIFPRTKRQYGFREQIQTESMLGGFFGRTANRATKRTRL